MKFAAAARGAITDPARITIVGGDPSPRFELFHAGISLCSQKVRAVLCEKGLSYRSNDMTILCLMGGDRIIPAENYHPAYIRLRLLARQERGQEFVLGFSGRMSGEREGFDPCLVPLLIDHQADRVIADSRRICCYLDALSREPIQLVPGDSEARAEVMRQVGIVDSIPNGSLLYGFHPDADRRPDGLKLILEMANDYKVMALEGLIFVNSSEPELIAAYRAKIAKVRGGKRVCHNAAFQRAARDGVGKLLTDLERDLAGKAGPYLKGNSFSLGDLVWGCNLIRLAYLGLAPMWAELPNVERFFRCPHQAPLFVQGRDPGFDRGDAAFRLYECPCGLQV
jgi:glutathione S-transferase